MTAVKRGPKPTSQERPYGDLELTLAVDYTADDGRQLEADTSGWFTRDEAGHLLRTGRARITETTAPVAGDEKKEV